MTSRAIIMSFIIFTVAFATNWFLEDSNPDPEAEDLTRNDPDLYMLDATIRQYSDNGDLDHELSAERFTHFPLTDLTTLTTPSLILFSNDSIPWAITAKHGRLLPESTFREEAVELWEDVLAIKQQPDGRFINIQTESLTVYPGRDYAETDKKVYIDDNNARTTAAGIQANFNQGRFVFFSTSLDRVNTVYLPAHRR